MIHTDGTPTIANGAGDFDPNLPYDAETQRIKRERSFKLNELLAERERIDNEIALVVWAEDTREQRRHGA